MLAETIWHFFVFLSSFLSTFFHCFFLSFCLLFPFSGDRMKLRKPETKGDVDFVRFLRIQLYKSTRKLLQNVFCKGSCTFFAMDKKFPWRSKLGSKLTVFWVHKDMSKSYREGIDQKLKTMAFPYKMKGWQKSYKLCIFIL